MQYLVFSIYNIFLLDLCECVFLFDYLPVQFHIVVFLFRYLSWESCSIFDVQSWDKQDCKALTNSLSFDGIVHMMFCLLQNAETQIQESYNDFLNAAFKQPVFGLFLKLVTI